MNHWFMVTVVGKDQPGIVAHITRVLFEAGCNLGEASMARLGNSFTMMFMVQAPVEESVLQQLLQPSIEMLNVHLHVDKIEGVLHRSIIPNVGMSIYGADQAGLVAQATATLAEIDFNIISLESTVAGSHSRPIYVMNIEGYAAGGADAVRSVISRIVIKGLDVRITSIDSLFA